MNNEDPQPRCRLPASRPCWAGRHRGLVVGHQAVGEDLQVVLPGLLLEKFQVHPAVVIHEEHVLAVIPTLRDMMGTPNGDGSGYSWHGANLPSRTRLRQQNNRRLSPVFVPCFRFPPLRFQNVPKYQLSLTFLIVRHSPFGATTPGSET
jgi:hypothetical protein